MEPETALDRPTRPAPKRRAAWVRALVAGLPLAVAALATLATAFAQRHWLLDALTHFRLQILGLALLLALAFGLWHRWVTSGAAASIAIVNAVMLLPWSYLAGGAAPGEAERWVNVRVVALNILSTNPHVEMLVTMIEEAQPDLVLLTEVTRHTREALAARLSAYPHLRFRNWGRSGTAIFSRLPMADKRGPYAGFGSASATVFLEGGAALHVIAVHPPSPDNPRDWQWRNDALNSLAAVTADLEVPVIVGGDFNCSPWSPFLRKVMEEGRLRYPGTVISPPPTWPMFLPAFARIPIDHILVSPGLRVTRYRLGPHVQSDHRPVIADVAVALP